MVTAAAPWLADDLCRRAGDIYVVVCVEARESPVSRRWEVIQLTYSPHDRSFPSISAADQAAKLRALAASRSRQQTTTDKMRPTSLALAATALVVVSTGTQAFVPPTLQPSPASSPTALAAAVPRDGSDAATGQLGVSRQGFFLGGLFSASLGACVAARASLSLSLCLIHSWRLTVETKCRRRLNQSCMQGWRRPRRQRCSLRSPGPRASTDQYVSACMFIYIRTLLIGMMMSDPTVNPTGLLSDGSAAPFALTLSPCTHT